MELGLFFQITHRALQWTRHCNRHLKTRIFPVLKDLPFWFCEEMSRSVTDVWSSEWQLRWSDWGLCLLHLWSHASPSACLTSRGEKILKFTIVEEILHKCARSGVCIRSSHWSPSHSSHSLFCVRSHLFDEWAQVLSLDAADSLLVISLACEGLCSAEGLLRSSHRLFEPGCPKQVRQLSDSLLFVAAST